MNFIEALDEQRAEILAACTRCGACAEVCPMLPAAGLATADPAALARGIAGWLEGGAGERDRGGDRSGEGTGERAGDDASARWAEVCSGSGHCISACAEGINPRFMLALARLSVQEARLPRAERQRAGVDRFRTVSRGVRVLSRLQLPPDLLARLDGRGDQDGDADPDVVFWTGCNVLKTPHIALLCLDVLDRLGARYAVRGGSAHCCGTLNFTMGDAAAGGRMGLASGARLGRPSAPTVLSWCPNCQIQHDEITQPAARRMGAAQPFAMQPFARFLVERLDDLRPLMVHPVRRRVALHEHAGDTGKSAAVRRLLDAVPGLDFVDLGLPLAGYMCTTLNAAGPFKAEMHRQLLEAAAAAGVDTLAGVNHACHRDLCSHERDWPFAVVNFMELIGESLGLDRPDLFKRLKIMQDVDAILAACRDTILAHDLDIAEVREIVLTQMLGDQTLPLKG